MNHYAVAQLAEIRRQELIEDATIQWQARRHRTDKSAGSRRHSRRPMSAFRAWVAAAQL